MIDIGIILGGIFAIVIIMGYIGGIGDGLSFIRTIIYKIYSKILKKIPLSEKFELDIEWCNNQFNKNNFNFKEELYVENSIDDRFKKILVNDIFLVKIESTFTNIKKYLLELKEFNESSYLDYKSEHTENLLICIDYFIKEYNETLIELDKFINFLKKKEFEKLENFKLDIIRHDINKASNDYSEIYEDLSNNEKYNKEMLEKSSKLFFQLLDELNFFISELEYSKISDLHIFGSAYHGKTYTSKNLCHSMLRDGKPALFISGSKFVENKSVKSQLKTILDIPSQFTIEKFLDALNKLAKAHKTKLPIIIDGLNESTNGISTSNIWENDLKEFINEIRMRKNLSLITTCRETYKDYIWDNENWGNENPKNIIYGPEFHGKVKDELITKYFNYYNLKGTITNASFYQLSNPLYLRIFCKSKNPERKREVEIFMGEDSMYEFFDEYINHSNKNILKLFNVDFSANIVEPSLKKIGQLLWENNSRHVPLVNAYKLIDKTFPENINILKSKTRALIHENLFIVFDRINGKDEISFDLDLFAGYIIAKYLFKKYNNIESIINSDENLESLFSDVYSKLHPLHEDIKKSLAILSISKNNKYLHEASENDNVVKVSIEALFEIPPNKITEDCVNFTKNYFLGLKNPNFYLFNNSLLVEKHPFNSIFLFDLLSSMKLTERDLKWTEDVRNNAFDFKKNIEYFEDLCKNNQTSKNTLKLFTYYLIWCLSSVNYMVRDKATQALYYYGKIFPEDFFELVLKSFDINDPWISERMLAAAYGIAMALQYDTTSNFSGEILSNWAKTIYNLIFKKQLIYPNHSTTHLLKRDYAKGIIEIALIHDNDLFTKIEKERVKPPYEDGGIRIWRESKDKDKERYMDSNFPLDEYSQNDVISKLGPEMDKYQRNKEYKKAKAQIFWRIYDLGYALDKFGEIDKKIAEKRYRYSNLSSDEFIEWNFASKYGEKYVDIALLELAGYRDDLGKLRSDYDEGTHTHLADIDPSFPVDFKNYKIINKNFGVVDNAPKDKWLKQKIPNLKKFLYLTNIDGYKDSWILLDGFFNLQDKDMKKQIYLFSRGFFVHEKDEEEIYKFLKTQDLSNRYLPELFENHNIFAGEIPWSKMFVEDKWDEISFENGFEDKECPIEKRVLTKNNELLSEEEKTDLYNHLSKNEKVQLDSQLSDVRTNNTTFDFGFAVDYDNLLNYFDEYEKNKENVLNSLNKKLDEKNVEISTIYENKTKKEIKYKTFEVLCSVRNYHWEDNNIGIHQDKNVSVPIKQISKSFNLFNRPQTFDLYDTNGKASITVQSFDNYGKSQHFTYLRKDLLDKFLEINNYKFIMVIWGNKEIFSDDNHPYIEKIVPIKQIVKYNELNSFKLYLYNLFR